MAERADREECPQPAARILVHKGASEEESRGALGRQDRLVPLEHQAQPGRPHHQVAQVHRELEIPEVLALLAIAGTQVLQVPQVPQGHPDHLARRALPDHRAHRAHRDHRAHQGVRVPPVLQARCVTTRVFTHTMVPATTGVLTPLRTGVLWERTAPIAQAQRVLQARLAQQDHQVAAVATIAAFGQGTDIAMSLIYAPRGQIAPIATALAVVMTVAYSRTTAYAMSHSSASLGRTVRTAGFNPATLRFQAIRIVCG